MSNLKPIANWPTYFISSQGEVIRIKNGVEKTLAGGVGARGYRLVTLCNGDKRKNGMIHRLVAEAFLGKSDLQVNHKNGIKTDNRLENLEYCTQSENLKHAYDTGLAKALKGTKSPKSHLLDSEVEIIKALRGEMPQTAIAKLFGIGQQTVCQIQTGKAYV